MATAEAVSTNGIKGAAIPFVALVGAGGLAATAYAATQLAGTPALPLEVFCVGAGLAELGRVESKGGGLALSLSLAVIVGALVAFGLPGAVIVAGAAALANGVYPSLKSLPKVAFNFGIYTLGALAGGLAYQAIAGSGHMISMAVVPATIVATLVNFAVNWPLLAGIICLTTGKSLGEVIADDISWTPAPIILAATLGAALGTNFLLYGWVGVGVFAIPLAGLQLTLHYTQPAEE